MDELAGVATMISSLNQPYGTTAQAPAAVEGSAQPQAVIPPAISVSKPEPKQEQPSQPTQQQQQQQQQQQTQLQDDVGDEDEEGDQMAGGSAAAPDLPFLRKGCLITISPDDLVSLSSRVMEARIASLTIWESKAVGAGAGPLDPVVAASAAASGGRRSMKVCVGDTVEFVLKQKKSAHTSATPASTCTGIVTRITFATSGPECKTVGQKMVRVTSFPPAAQSPGGTVTVSGPETTHSVSPGRIRKIAATARELDGSVVSRLRAFFEKNDNAYRDCFLEWAAWNADERAEYCARCTAGDMVAAAGIAAPTDEQVRTFLERARTIVNQARSNVSSINSSRGGPDEPAPRRRRQSKPRQPKNQPPFSIPDPSLAIQASVGIADVTGPPPPRKRKSGAMPPMAASSLPQAPSESITAPQATVASSAAPTATTAEDAAAYRELIRQLREEHARREREIRAECDRRVEEVRASLMAEIERLNGQLAGFASGSYR